MTDLESPRDSLLSPLMLFVEKIGNNHGVVNEVMMMIMIMVMVKVMVMMIMMNYFRFLIVGTLFRFYLVFFV